MEWALELLLIGLLAATMFHAIRLERALGVLKRDRAALEELVAGFNTSTRHAEQGIDRLRIATDGVGRQMARQIESAVSLKDDLTFLLDRSDKAADRLDRLVRSARPMMGDPPRTVAPELLRAVALEPPRASTPELPRAAAPEPARPADTEAGAVGPRIRSQAERDLLKALRMAR